MVNDGMGYFWFLDSYSVDLFVSVSDLMGVDGNFWVFAGGLSNVVYTLRVTDTQTGVVKTYFNPLGSFIVFTDTTAFPPIPKSTRERKQVLPFPPSLAQLRGSVSNGFKGLTAASPVAGGCTVGPTMACLQGGRFQVSVEWKDFVANTGSGQTAAGIQTNDSSGFSFEGHFHNGPGEYFLTKGKIEVRSGEEEGGVSANGLSYGYEACNARHDETLILEDSKKYMTFQGPLQLTDDDGRTVGVLGWEQAQAMWDEQAG